MHSNRKGKQLLLVHTAVASVVAVSAFAFIQQNAANGAVGSPESVAHATVPGTQIGVLPPGETAYVTLWLTNPHANVKAELQPISAGDVVIDTVANPADKAYCHGQVELSTVGADPHLPTLAKQETNHPHKMIDAVKLKAETDFRCQGMTYHTMWFVHLKAVHQMHERRSRATARRSTRSQHNELDGSTTASTAAAVMGDRIGTFWTPERSRCPRKAAAHHRCCQRCAAAG